ncbi:pimeloyl-ACP methyl ester carboxylesterase [Variovorax boronicumulans]|uniref:alpha/beta fold hydrolase n=1 Tax=Variovorax boronicumulans TaxID=436515 RepID=UPI00278A551F|nr:alpha/beta fold hydrolase [Variovorax boronicumulans]MDP9996105.1 pimeloyl-ACP methyl ester carboxylesterase [Variovorax boronicumulans]MDQ0002576.1 pimeloyl-ACP methyl ester carboxylesterase [Variovorax boronicumulans]
MQSRRTILALPLTLGLASTAMLTACATAPSPSFTERPPIVFMHGNGDSAALWQTTIWRFESNGWPRDRLFAVDQPNPLARDDDAVAQPGRSSTKDSAVFLKAEVEKVLKATGASKVVLIGNSRGGNTIRNYVQNGGGAAVVSHVVLGGNPAHGIWAVKGFRENNEFSGLSGFMQQLNAPKGANGDEVTPGVKWLTLRSDNNDKYAQPDGVWIGAPGKPTNIGFEGPALKGATNVVLPRVDHRETSFSPAAFAATWQFLTGQAPRSTAVAAETNVVLDGRAIGAENLSLNGGQLRVYAVDPATGVRQGDAVHSKNIGADGRWGPFSARGGTAYEFVLSAPGYGTTHIYRSPFPRSSGVVNLRPERITPSDGSANVVVVFTRPRGYFDAERDTMRFDGQSLPAGVPPKGSGVSSSRLRIAASEPQRAVTGEFNGERITGLTWPAVKEHVTVLELTY